MTLNETSVYDGLIDCYGTKFATVPAKPSRIRVRGVRCIGRTPTRWLLPVVRDYDDTGLMKTCAEEVEEKNRNPDDNAR